MVGRDETERRTALLELFRNLIVLSAQLCPLRKLVLTTRSIKLFPELQDLTFQGSLFGRGL